VSAAQTDQKEASKPKYMAAVSDGEIRFLSVSQISTFDPTQAGGCERKWWFSKVKRLPAPETQAQADGTAMHSEIAHYVTTGEDVLGPLARAGKHFIPAPDPRLEVETEVSGLCADGIPLQTKIDLVNPTGFYLDSTGELRPDPEGTVEVLDWKSTSNLKYARRGIDLLQTIQMPGYAKALLPRGFTHARLSHVYFQKRGKKQALKSTALFSLAQINDRWQEIDLTVRRMKVVAQATEPDQVTPNYDSCGAYGGCAYRDVCPRVRTNAQILNELFGGSKMGLLGKLNGLSSSNSQPQPAQNPLTAPAPSIPVPHPALPEVKPQGGLGGLLNKAKGLSAPAAEPSPAQKVLDANPGFTSELQKEVAALEAEEKALKSGENPFIERDSGAGVHRVSDLQAEKEDFRKSPLYHTPILPPDSAKSEGANSAAPLPASANVAPEIREAAEAIGAVEKPLDGAPSAPTEKVKRGRRTKAEIEAAKACESNSKPVGMDQFVAEMEARENGNKALKEALLGEDPKPQPLPEYCNLPVKRLDVGGLALFVDCTIEAGSHIVVTAPLEPYVDKLCNDLAAQFKAADIRCASKDSPLSYGGWKGALAALIRNNPPAHGCYTLRDVRESEIKAVVVETLKPLCAMFIRGV
jgi:hypothetical protein